MAAGMAAKSSDHKGNFCGSFYLRHSFSRKRLRRGFKSELFSLDRQFQIGKWEDDKC